MRGTAEVDKGMTPANLNKATGYFDPCLSG